MAKINGAVLRYNNTDDESRLYDLSAETVITDNEVESVQSINLSKEGKILVYGSISGINSQNPYASFNVNHTYIDDYKTLLGLVVDFANTIKQKAEEVQVVNISE